MSVEVICGHFCPSVCVIGNYRFCHFWSDCDKSQRTGVFHGADHEYGEVFAEFSIDLLEIDQQIIDFVIFGPIVTKVSVRGFSMALITNMVKFLRNF